LFLISLVNLWVILEYQSNTSISWLSVNSWVVALRSDYANSACRNQTWYGIILLFETFQFWLANTSQFKCNHASLDMICCRCTGRQAVFGWSSWRYINDLAVGCCLERGLSTKRGRGKFICYWYEGWLKYNMIFSADFLLWGLTTVACPDFSHFKFIETWIFSLIFIYLFFLSFWVCSIPK